MKYNFEWCADNLFDILVVYYLDDTRKDIGVKILKNTRKLVFQGILKSNKDKLKLDTLDLSNFNSDFLVELKDYNLKLCEIEAVRPIETSYFLNLFKIDSSKLKSYIYSVKEIPGGVL